MSGANMIWSIVKVGFFIALAAALAFASSYVLQTPGEVRVAFGGREVSFAPLAFVVGIALIFVALWLVFRLAGLLAAFARFLSGDETAFSRYWDRNRERRGFEALTEGLIALSSGEGAVAVAKATKAEHLLARPELTQLVNAQAAELAGDSGRAAAYYKEMLKNERTKFVGIRGLLKSRLAVGDTATALKLAERAFALKPRHGETLDVLFGLQSQGQDWAGARKTLEAKVRAKALPRDVAVRRDAVLSLADAQASLAKGDADKARAEVMNANRLVPGFVPAAALAADQYVAAGNKKAAVKVLLKAWGMNPHPELAAAFARVEAGELPSERRVRFGALLKAGSTSSEAKLLEAELALTCEDFPAVRRAMGDLAEREPNTRSLAIMAAIERGQGGDDKLVRGWLTKAIVASRGNQWVCESCGHAHVAWVPVCESCAAFDSLAWKPQPDSIAPDAATAAMLPLIVGEIEGPE
jgi:HemY protein